MTAPSDPPSKDLRADAERNRERVLAAARAAFAEPGADVSMAEIARRAGVGSATLYRNFANRRELLEAVYVEEIDDLCEAATAYGDDPPGAALIAWLGRFYDYFTGKQLLAAALLEHVDSDAPVFGTGYARVIGAGRPLLQAAREADEVRGDLSLEQIVDMVGAIARIPGDPDYRGPILAAALESLRKDSARP